MQSCIDMVFTGYGKKEEPYFLKPKIKKNQPSETHIVSHGYKSEERKFFPFISLKYFTLIAENLYMC